MKWSITQLRKYQGKPFEFEINEVIADMHVTGTYTMPCARTRASRCASRCNY